MYWYIVMVAAANALYSKEFWGNDKEFFQLEKELGDTLLDLYSNFFLVTGGGLC